MSAPEPQAQQASAAQASPPAYAARDGDAARDRDAVLAVWQGNLGQDARMAAKYDWFYLRAPAGAPVMQLLAHAGAAAPVGACSAGRRRMLRDGLEIRAGVLVDLAVTPEHRTLGPALILQQGLFAAGKRELDQLYGFPNPKAAPVFKRIGYRKLGDMVRHARVVRHALYVQRRATRLPAPLAAVAGAFFDIGTGLRDRWRVGGSALHAHWHDRAPDIDALWSASPKPSALTAVRDAAHLRWRFDDAPVDASLPPFRHLLLRDARGDAAWFATRADAHTLHVHDAWTRDGGATPSPAIVLSLLRAARKAGFSVVSVELATNAARLQPWRDLGFEARGQRPVFGTDFNAGAEGDADLHLVSADEDE
ncbi:MAG: hypothetical protein JNM58_08690 [Xanthomonadaceae bacterium]|nr:hypothetical protein [Xanthomonadaceae bacterium]